MTDVEYRYFQLLKQDVANTLRRSFPEVNEHIEQWKGWEIGRLQEDLEDKAGGRISEKWFYTHIKSEAGSLPRIDVLDLLSQYVGSSNWADYKLSKTNKRSSKPSFNKRAVLLVFLGTIISTVVAVNTSLFTKGTYRFCFIDAYSRKPIPPDELEVVMLHEKESPYVADLTNESCLTLSKDVGRMVRFVVRSAYYKTDTIARILNKNRDHEHIGLSPDDYALMIRIFSNSDVEDWNSRRSQLQGMVADHARIFQVVDESNVPMEVYNKQEFINKLTMPIKSLRNIEIIETVYEKDKIVSLRFAEIKDETND